MGPKTLPLGDPTDNTFLNREATTNPELSESDLTKNDLMQDSTFPEMP